MPRPTDGERATAVRSFYGLDGSEPILTPGYRPLADAPQGATDFEKSMRKRLDNLTRDSHLSIAGPKEADALQEAQLPLTLIGGRGWKINRASARSEAELKADALDQQRADNVHTFYGLDGSEPILAPGYVPSDKAPKGATDFEKSMRIRLDGLARPSPRYSAGPKEAAALQDAGLPVTERQDGKFNIDRASARSEVQAKAEALDQQRADNVRTFYGLDGSEPILAPGYRPSPDAPQGATDFEKSMRKRLDKLTRDRNAGPKEALALQEAQLPLKQIGNEAWSIDRASARSEAMVKEDAIDILKAADVRTFYGLDGSDAVMLPGNLPSSHSPQGASEFEISMRQRLASLTKLDSHYSAGPEEATALQEANLPLKQRQDGRWNIDKTAVVAQQNPAIAYDHDSGYVMNPVAAGRYLPSAHGYSHAGSSSRGGSPAEGPSRPADRASKRGRAR